MPRLFDALGDEDADEPFTLFPSASREASPAQAQISSSYRFVSLITSPASPANKSVRSSAHSSPMERLNAVGDKPKSPMQSQDSARLSSSVSAKPKSPSRGRPASNRKAESKPTRLSSSLTKRELRPRGNPDAKGVIRKAGRPAKTAVAQRKKRTLKEDASTTKAQGGRKEWEVEQIVDSRIDEETLEHWFKVKWKGYAAKDNTWEPKKNLTNCKVLVEKYEKKAGK